MNSMFVSGWEEEDDEGVQEKDLTDPKEQFLTAAEEGDSEKLKRMFLQRPEYLHVSYCLTFQDRLEFLLGPRSGQLHTFASGRL